MHILAALTFTMALAYGLFVITIMLAENGRKIGLALLGMPFTAEQSSSAARVVRMPVRHLSGHQPVRRSAQEKLLLAA
jgi:hypothetical protein